MKLVFFDCNINFGGAPQGTVYLAERLAQKHDVHVIDAYGKCKDYCSAIRKVNLPLHILMPHAKNTYIGLSGLKRILKMLYQLPAFLRLQHLLIQKILQIKPDVIWLNDYKSLVLVVTSFRLRKIPVAIYIRNWATSEHLGKVYCWLLKNKVRAIIAHSHASILQLKNRGIAEDKLHYTPNTINFDEVKECARSEINNLKFDDKALKILLPAARPVFEKGHLAAVKAISILKEKGLNPLLILPGVVATGVSDDFFNDLNKLIETLGVKENVWFVGWQSNMPALIAKMDIVILPSHSEGFPRAILEAMFLKKPVVATAVGGIPEAVRDGQTGFICEMENETNLAEKVLLLVNEPNKRAEIVENAYNLVNEAYRPENNTKVVAEVFEKLSIKN